MPITVKTAISLTDEQDAYARALVAPGHYPRVTAVVQRGLEILRRDAETHRVEIQGLQTLIDQRRSEPLMPLEENPQAFLATIDREG